MKNNIKKVVISWSASKHLSLVEDICTLLKNDKSIEILDKPKKIDISEYPKRLAEFFWNIDNADELIVVNPQWYIWSWVFSEIIYAVIKWKKVSLLSPISDQSTGRTELELLEKNWSIITKKAD